MFHLAALTLIPTDINSPTGGLNSVFELLANVINFALFAAGALSLIFVLVGAFRYVTSSGNPQATAGAKNTILYAIVGLVLTIMALVIVTYVKGIFG